MANVKIIPYYCDHTFAKIQSKGMYMNDFYGFFFWTGYFCDKNSRQMIAMVLYWVALSSIHFCGTCGIRSYA